MTATPKKTSAPILGVKSTMNDEWQMNLRRLFERGVICQPTSELVTKTSIGYHRMTFKKMQQRATQIASALATELNIKPGDRIGTLMWNNGRHMILYYAVPCMGAVLHALNMRLHPTELTYIIQHAKDQVIFVDANLLPILEQLPQEALRFVRKIIVCGPNEAVL
ncbi:medium-chain fatty acid-CoA ligase, partial [Reticulomyxa filosa]